MPTLTIFGDYGILAKSIKSLTLPYPMIQFLIIEIIALVYESKNNDQFFSAALCCFIQYHQETQMKGAQVSK